MQAALERSDLWLEVRLFRRLIYKNNSQHRGSKHWQYLLQVCSLLASLHTVSCLPHMVQPFLLQLQVQRQLRLLDALNLAQLFAHLGKAARGSTVPVSSAASLLRFSRCYLSFLLPQMQLVQRLQLATPQRKSCACSRQLCLPADQQHLMYPKWTLWYLS